MLLITLPHTQCSGCNACAEICPKHCIKMVPDKKGFLYPNIDSTICINCGACEKICPIKKKQYRTEYPDNSLCCVE